VKKVFDFTRVIRLGSYGPRFLHQLRIDASVRCVSFYFRIITNFFTLCMP